MDVKSNIHNDDILKVWQTCQSALASQNQEASIPGGKYNTFNLTECTNSVLFKFNNILPR